MKPAEKIFDSGEQLAQQLAQSIADDLRRAVSARGRASLVVSGGRTPARMFAALARQPLAWDKIWITYSDERWVSASHPDSNQAMVQRTLLQHDASAAHFVPLKNSAETAGQGAAECAKAIAAMSRPFDVVILGMGDDGRFASLFPLAPQLAAGLDLTNRQLCIAVDPVSAPHARMRLTLAALLASRRIVIQLSGTTKQTVIHRALQDGAVEELPIRAILRQTQTPVEIYWSN
ncbi:MAG: 6-phosphogluconolactonase [Burkholderiales bacterium]